MTIAALIVFGVLLASWLLAPAERRQRRAITERGVPELLVEAA
jgi:hypothetical protein